LLQKLLRRRRKKFKLRTRHILVVVLCVVAFILGAVAVFYLDGSIDHKLIEFARESKSDDIVLGVKANILRLWKRGEWEITPRDYFFKRYKILAINPGSTSTKYSYYEGDRCLHLAEIHHNHKRLQQFTTIAQQQPLRHRTIVDDLNKQGLGNLKQLDAVVARGGLIRPVKSGVYRVNTKMCHHLAQGLNGHHPANLGGLMAYDMGRENNIPAYIVDPPVVDEADEAALDEAERLRANDEDEYYLGKCLLYLNQRLEDVEKVREAAENYLHFGQEETQHAELLLAIEAAKEAAEKASGGDEGDFGLG